MTTNFYSDTYQPIGITERVSCTRPATTLVTRACDDCGDTIPARTEMRVFRRTNSAIVCVECAEILDEVGA